MGDPLRDDSWLFGKGIKVSVLQNPLRTHMDATGEERVHVLAHWHRYQDEEHIVLKGRIKLTQDGVTRDITPADGGVITSAGVVHSFEGFLGEELSMDEIARPSREGLSMEEIAERSIETNEQKILFFRNLCAPGVVESLLASMQVFYYGDAYPALPFKNRWFEWLLVVIVGGWIAPWFGYQLPAKGLQMDPKRFPPSKRD